MKNETVELCEECGQLPVRVVLTRTQNRGSQKIEESKRLCETCGVIRETPYCDLRTIRNQEGISDDR